MPKRTKRDDDDYCPRPEVCHSDDDTSLPMELDGSDDDCRPQKKRSSKQEHSAFKGVTKPVAASLFHFLKSCSEVIIEAAAAAQPKDAAAFKAIRKENPNFRPLLEEIARLESENAQLQSEKAQLAAQVDQSKAEIAELKQQVAGLTASSAVSQHCPVPSALPDWSSPFTSTATLAMPTEPPSTQPGFVFDENLLASFDFSALQELDLSIFTPQIN